MIYPRDWYNTRKSANSTAYMRQRESLMNPQYASYFFQTEFPGFYSYEPHMFGKRNFGDFNAGSPFSMVAGKWDLVQRLEQKMVKPAFSGWWSLIAAGIGIGGYYAFDLYKQYQEAKTEQERERLKEQAYQDYKDGKITEDMYKLILGVTPENSWLVEYAPYLVLGSAGLLFILILLLAKKR